MNVLKNLKLKKLAGPALIIALGIMTLVAIKLMPGPQKTPEATLAKQPAETESTADDYESRLEKRLEGILSKAAGAGRVKVMVTLAGEERAIVERNEVLTEQNTDETDSSGGTRRQSQSSLDSKAVIIRSADGSESPLITYEERPKIEGVIIIAEGGGDVVVRDALIRAVQTVLGIEVHKVSVLKGSY